MASTELQQKLQKRRSLQGENAVPLPSPSPRRERAPVVPKSVSGSVRTVTSSPSPNDEVIVISEKSFAEIVT